MKHLLPILLLPAMLLIGCEMPSTTGNASASQPPKTQQIAPANSAQRPVAYINGQALTQADLINPLIEAAGGTVLSEIVLDRMIHEKLAAAGLTLTPELIEQEKTLILATLSDDPNEAARLLQTMRSARGMGEQRFQAMLFRNAGLRLLVKDEVELVPTLLRQAYQLQHGERYRVRIIVAGTLAQANALLVRAKAGESFSDLAAMNSIDPSAAQGGLLSPISPHDPTYPSALRQALGKLETGGISDLIATDDHFIIMKLEEKLPADTISYEAALPDLARALRRELEGQRIQQAARALLAEAKVVVLDPALNNSWQAQQQRTQGE